METNRLKDASTIERQAPRQRDTHSPLKKRRIGNDLVLIHKIICNETDLESTQLFKSSRGQGLRMSSIRFLHQTGRTRRRRDSFACRVVKYCNRLPLAVASVPEQRAFKNNMTYIITHKCFLLSLFSPQYGLFRQSVLSQLLNTYRSSRSDCNSRTRSSCLSLLRHGYDQQPPYTLCSETLPHCVKSH